MKILFAGYAPVHFVCFQPIFDRLIADDRMDVFVSGGIRTKRGAGYDYDGAALYKPFGVTDDRIIDVETVQDRHFDMMLSANKRMIAPAENFGTTVQMFHGVSFRNRAVRPENLNYHYFFVIGSYMQQKFVDAELLDANDVRAIPIGFPKTDRLLNDKTIGAALRNRYGFDGSRPVLLYAPTGEAYNSLETFGEHAIQQLVEADRFDLLIKPHDHPKNNKIDWFDRLSALEGPHTRLMRDADIVPALAASDLLITDASSVANEFALLDRPIIFLDVPELLANSRANGALLDLETWGRKGGVTVPDAGSVVEAVDHATANPDHLSDVRQAIAKNLFYNPGRATDAAMCWIEERFEKFGGKVK